MDEIDFYIKRNQFDRYLATLQKTNEFLKQSRSPKSNEYKMLQGEIDGLALARRGLWEVDSYTFQKVNQMCNLDKLQAEKLEAHSRENELPDICSECDEDCETCGRSPEDCEEAALQDAAESEWEARRDAYD